MEQPFIFLFTCVYNDRKHISKLFDSIKSQTSNNFVYYLYDDCSDDNYDDLFNKLKDELSKNKILCYYEKGKTNLGINKATEHCLQILRDNFKKCTHFVWINSDDFLSTNYINDISRYISKFPKYSAYLPNLKLINGEVEKRKYTRSQMRKASIYLIDLFYRTPIYTHFVVAKNEYLNINSKCLIYKDENKTAFFNDVSVLFLLSVYDKKILYINKILSNYYMRPTSLSYKKIGEKRNKYLFINSQLDYLTQLEYKNIEEFKKKIRILFTHITCLRYVENRLYKNSKNHFRKSNELFKTIKINKKYLYPLNSSFLLFHFPHAFAFLHALKKKLTNKTNSLL